MGRRAKIWDYERYDAAKANSKTKTTDSEQFDDAEFLAEKRNRERAAKAKSAALERKIEIRRMKRKLIRMKSEKRSQNQSESEWIDDGAVLRDAKGRTVDIERELERKERTQKRNEKMKMENEREMKKMEKQRQK